MIKGQMRARRGLPAPIDPAIRDLHADAARGPNTDLEEFAPVALPKTEVGGIAADRLRSVIERIEHLEGERKALASEISDIYSEAKGAGFDVKVIRQVIALRKKEPAEVEKTETLLDLYKRALGM